jgi:hypothetical protein
MKEPLTCAGVEDGAGTVGGATAGGGAGDNPEFRRRPKAVRRSSGRRSGGGSYQVLPYRATDMRSCIPGSGPPFFDPEVAI